MISWDSHIGMICKKAEMAATHEVAPDALPFSGQEYEQLSTSNSNFSSIGLKLANNIHPMKTILHIWII